MARSPGLTSSTCTSRWAAGRRRAQASTPGSRSARSARPATRRAATCTSSAGAHPAGTSAGPPTTRCPSFSTGTPTPSGAPASPATRRPAELAAVLEARAVPADAPVAELQRAVLDDELVRHQLLALAVVTWDHAGDRLRSVVAVPDPNADVIADPEQLAAPRVLDLNRHGADGDPLARLPHPREVGLGVPAAGAREDLLEGVALGCGGARIEIEDPGPGRALLIIAVGQRQRDGLPAEIDTVPVALVDQPGEDAGADAVGRAATRDTVDSPAGTDRIAVAGLEVAAADPPAHPLRLDACGSAARGLDPVVEGDHPVLVGSHPGELHRRAGQAPVEERLSVAEHDRHDGDENLLEETRVRELRGHVAAADDPEVALSGRGQHLVVEVRHLRVLDPHVHPFAIGNVEVARAQDPVGLVDIGPFPAVGELAEDELVGDRPADQGADAFVEALIGAALARRPGLRARGLERPLVADQPVESVVGVRDVAIECRRAVVLRAHSLPHPVNRVAPRLRLRSTLVKRHGRYWARTSDLQLVELALSQLS